MSRSGKLLGEGLLWVGALAGLLSAVVAVGALLFGLQPLIFRSGSMEPAVDTGSLGLAHRVDASELKVGDIVSVPTEDDSRVTHRIVEITPADDQTSVLRLKGDANNAVDEQAYTVTEADRLMFSVPVLGTVVAWLSRAPGIFVLAGYLAVMVALILRRGEDDHDPRGGRRIRTADDSSAGDPEEPEGAGDSERDGRAGARVAAMATLTLVAAACGTPAAIAAPWQDSAGVGTSVIATGSVPTVGAIRCVDDGQLVRFTWTTLGPDYSYDLEFRKTGTTAVLGTRSVAPVVSGTVTYRYTATEFSHTTLNTKYEMLVRATPNTSAAWRSPSATVAPYRSGSFYAATIYCGN